jgi:hypothetical protein
MRRRIVTRDRQIPALADHLLAQNQHGADGYLACQRRLPRQLQCAAHEVGILRRIRGPVHVRPRRLTYRVAKMTMYRRNNAAAL